MVAAHARFLALSLWEARSDFADVQLNCKDGVLHLNRYRKGLETFLWLLLMSCCGCQAACWVDSALSGLLGGILQLLGRGAPWEGLSI